MVLLSVYYYLKHLYIYVPQVYDDASHFPWIFYGRQTYTWRLIHGDRLIPAGIFYGRGHTVSCPCPVHALSSMCLLADVVCIYATLRIAQMVRLADLRLLWWLPGPCPVHALSSIPGSTAGPGTSGPHPHHVVPLPCPDLLVQMMLLKIVYC